MTFVRGARVADDTDGVAIDLSALADKRLLFRDPSRSGVPGTADYIGKAVVAMSGTRCRPSGIRVATGHWALD